MLPTEALSKAYALKNQKMQSDMAAQEMNDNALMDQAYRAAGGDISKMQADPNMGFRGGMQIAKMQADRATAQAQADKEQAAADKLRLQSGIEKLNYGSQLLSGATPENWSQIRAEFGRMTGQDLGEQFDPAKVNALMQQGLSMKDKLANEWKQKGYQLDVAQFGEQQRHNRTAEGISYMNAQNGAANAGGMGKAPSGYAWSPDGTTLTPIKGGPADLKVQAQSQKMIAQHNKDISALENADVSATQSLSLIDQLAKHPGKEAAVGTSSVFNIAAIPGGDRQDFLAKLDQLKGQQFLQAFQSLKGGGAITEVEGKKAEQAIANMSTAQSEEQFNASLEDFRNVIAAGQARARQKLSQYNRDTSGEMSPPSGGSNIDDLLNKYGN